MFNDYDLQDSYTTDELYLSSGEVHNVIDELGIDYNNDAFA